MKTSDYYNDKVDELIAADTCFNNNLYWSRKQQLITSDLYVIDKTGIERIKSLSFGRKFVVIYIDCSENKRIEHMRMRGDTKKIYMKDCRTMKKSLKV